MSESTQTGEIVEAMCELLTRWAVKGMLPAHEENKYGVDVIYGTGEKLGEILFRFITKDSLEILLNFEMERLKEEGKDYINSRVELVMNQLEAAREEKQRRETIVIMPEKKPLVNAMTLAGSSTAN